MAVGPKQVFALVLLVAGVAMIGFGAYDYIQQSDALAAAVEVNATVTDTHIEQSSSGRSGIDYIPVVSFQYTFEDEPYNSSVMCASMSSRDYDSTAAAQDVLDDYTVGETVTAYVDSATPGDAFLNHERSQEPLTSLGLGAVTVLVRGFGVVRAYIGVYPRARERGKTT